MRTMPLVPVTSPAKRRKGQLPVRLRPLCDYINDTTVAPCHTVTADGERTLDGMLDCTGLLGAMSRESLPCVSSPTGQHHGSHHFSQVLQPRSLAFGSLRFFPYTHTLKHTHTHT